jgi:hypothetical protein
MDNKLYKRFQNLARTECCNYFPDMCILLDKKCPVVCCGKTEDGQPAQKMCSYLKDVVLQLDDKLMNDYLTNHSDEVFVNKECSICGKTFVPSDGRQTTCATCRAMDSKQKRQVKRFAKR